MVEVTQPMAAVFISPARPAMQDLAVLQEAQVRIVVFHDSVLEADVDAELREVEDPTERLLQGGPGNAGRASGGPRRGCGRCRPTRILCSGS
jgi:hypothetical protein